MHSYSINSDERKTAIGLMGIISLLIVLAIHKYLPEGTPAPSVLALFSGLFWIFDKWAWRWKFFQKTCIKTPDLNGDWQMLSTSSKTEMKETYEAVLTIKQTWTSISLFMDGQKATGISVMAGVDVMNDNLIYLSWEYRSEYKAEFDPEKSTHYGMTKLIMRPVNDRSKMQGRYYADETRHTYGAITINKKSLVSLPK